MPQQVDESGLPNVMAGEMPMGVEPNQQPLPFGGPGQPNQMSVAKVMGGHKGSGLPEMPGIN